MPVSGVYIDPSALGRVLLDEADAAAIVRELATFDRHISSRLTRVELRRLGLRHRLVDAATELMTTVALIPLDDDVLELAEVVAPPQVATLDAIHLATALLLLGDDLIDALMTYDRRLADAAESHGLPVLMPA